MEVDHPGLLPIPLGVAGDHEVLVAEIPMGKPHIMHHADALGCHLEQHHHLRTKRVFVVVMQQGAAEGASIGQAGGQQVLFADAASMMVFQPGDRLGGWYALFIQILSKGKSPAGAAPPAGLVIEEGLPQRGRVVFFQGHGGEAAGGADFAYMVPLGGESFTFRDVGELFQPGPHGRGIKIRVDGALKTADGFRNGHGWHWRVDDLARRSKVEAGRV